MEKEITGISAMVTVENLFLEMIFWVFVTWSFLPKAVSFSNELEMVRFLTS